MFFFFPTILGTILTIIDFILPAFPTRHIVHHLGNKTAVPSRRVVGFAQRLFPQLLDAYLLCVVVRVAEIALNVATVRQSATIMHAAAMILTT